MRANSDNDSPADNDPLPAEHTPEQIATAHHEAGHAVMAVSLGRTIHKVTIAPGKPQFGAARLGHCEVKKGRFKGSHDPLEDDVLILMAGMVAEARFTGQYCHRGAARDLKDVANLLCTRAASPRQHETLQRRMLAKTEHILRDAAHVEAIECIAKELLNKTTISGRSVRHHFQQAQQRNH
ncbi:ATP-dependent metallopeptidase FtsH/Yme1/Tma family protein [Aporhodopirellula aestuarii]|uniref:Cell division protein FtsH n=1 Tax=Aporhodopirellula aestuarii TaxID=2950107 RepID=A0ABT0U223_9BACT|nr:cell division protein FtsH [Aporhodopirellula aestuarii]MCM2370917.1 cell division protein FtsH [Aporhodopirellula aestuarii]